MASTGKIQPMRVTELMGHPKSAGKEPGSERKRMEPIRVKELLESFSKSCSRTIDVAPRRTFAIPGRGVRRKLYDPSPSPKASRPSLMPSKLPKGSTTYSRPSMFPPRNQLKSPQSKKSQAKLPARSQGKTRKSRLLPPNTIRNHHIEKTILESTILDTLTQTDDEKPLEQAPRPTVIICAESSKKIPEKKDEKVELNEIFPKDLDELEKSLENKENIPPPKESLPQPLSEKEIPKLTLISPELFQETLKRMEKMEIDVKEIKIEQNHILRGIERLLEILGDKELPLIKIDAPNFVEDKENVNSGSKMQRRSRTSTGERRRSARIASKLQNEGTDSFSQLEEELNIKHGKITKVVTPGRKTPVNDQFLRRKCKSERALREYLAIKASMSYLETPDAGSRKFKNIQENTPSGQKSLRRSISRKVFDELQDLYSEEDDLSNKIQL